MTLHLFTRGGSIHSRCSASVGNGVVCGRETEGESYCTFHRNLFGPYFKAAMKRAS